MLEQPHVRACAPSGRRSACLMRCAGCAGFIGARKGRGGHSAGARAAMPRRCLRCRGGWMDGLPPMREGERRHAPHARSSSSAASSSPTTAPHPSQPTYRALTTNGQTKQTAEYSARSGTERRGAAALGRRKASALALRGRGATNGRGRAFFRCGDGRAGREEFSEEVWPSEQSRRGGDRLER